MPAKPERRQTRADLDRRGMYNQGMQHRRFGLKIHYTRHQYLQDYLDGYHRRPFREKKRAISAWRRFLNWLGI